ncbi:MAG: hypothetical protein JXA94_06900 [Parachlamydiales bacterium]|nr:hypothetical protein [Parachlamydiales bacterium]
MVVDAVSGIINLVGNWIASSQDHACGLTPFHIPTEIHFPIPGEPGGESAPNIRNLS